MKKILFFTLIITIFNFSLSKTIKSTFENDGFNLPYTLFEPENLSSTEKVPLVIYLHGTGEAGTDNIAQTYPGGSIGFSYFVSNQNFMKSYVLAPQTPKNMRWASTTLDPYDFDKTPITKSLDSTLKLIDKLIKEKKIDKDRIYLLGLSRGGQGVWNAALHRPDFFAAIVPIAGSADPKKANLLTKLPIWAFHGSKDDVTSVEYTRDMVDAIIRDGGSTKLLRYTEIQGGDHKSSWISAHKGHVLIDWLKEQHK